MWTQRRSQGLPSPHRGGGEMKDPGSEVGCNLGRALGPPRAFPRPAPSSAVKSPGNEVVVNPPNANN